MKAQFVSPGGLPCRLCMVVVTNFILSASSVLAADSTWTNPSSGSWETPANWSLGLSPTNTDSMFITNSGTYTVNVDDTTANTGSSSTWLTVSNLTVGAVSGLPTLLVDFTNTAQSLSIGQLTVIGANQNGSMIVSNGTVVTRLMTIGTGSGAQGVLNVYNATLRVTNNASANAFMLGETSGSTGSVAVSGGTILVTNPAASTRTIIGSAGVGSMVISNGTLLTKTFILGFASSGAGNLSILNGGSVIVSGSGGAFFHLGSSGSGTILVDGGLLRVTNAATFEISRGANNAANGTLIVSNGFTELSGSTTVIGGSDYGGDGKWLIYGGTNRVTSSTFALGNNGSASPSKGTILMNGGLLDASGIDMKIGSLGIGTTTISNGTLLVGSATLGNGTKAIGTWNIAGGTSRVSSSVSIANAASSTGNVLVTGGQLFVTNASSTATIEIGVLGVGTMTMSNGTITADRFVATNGANGAFNFAGGTLNVKSLTLSNNSAFVVGNGSTAATLSLNGPTHSAANGLVLNTNSTLSGTGFSTLTLGGNLMLASNSTVVVDLMTNTLTGLDRIFVTGTVSLAESILSLRITNYTATVGTQFTIIDNDGTGDSVTGFFHGLTNNAFIDASANGQDGYFRILYNGGDGNDVVLLATIPEPSALCLAFGAVVLLRRFHRRHLANSLP